MTLTVTTGDLLSSGAQTLVNTVNTVGVMGKGIALEFKRRFPDMFKDYAERCARHEVRLGRPYLYRRQAPPWIINFPTKGHWREVSRLDDIIRGLQYVEDHYLEWGITSLAVPPLGCGNGQLEWRIVGRTLADHLTRLEIPVTLFAPHGTPQAEMSFEFLTGRSNLRVPANRMDPAWVALAAIVARIESERYHWPVGRTRFQKLAYFATQAGVPTGLDFERASYGPFAAGLKSIIARLENNGLLREERLGERMFRLLPGPTLAQALDEYHDDIGRWESTISNVADLFLRLDTKATEIAASVHLVATELGANGVRPSEAEVLGEVLRWKQRRKPPIQPDELGQSIRELNVLGWIDAEPSALPLEESEMLSV